MSWKRNAHNKKHLKLASQLVTCLQALYFLLEVIKNSYENKNRKRGFHWPQAWCRIFPKKEKKPYLCGRATLDSLWK